MIAVGLTGDAARKRKVLDEARDLGLLSPEQYDSKIAEFGVAGELVPMPTAEGYLVEDNSALSRAGWVDLGFHENYKEALHAVKADTYGPVKWAKKPGRPTDRRFVCNVHVDCTWPLRIVEKGAECKWLVQSHKDGYHTSEPKLKRRMNSVLTYEQEAVAVDMLRKGIRTYH